jgi:hypothetical protein
MQSTRMMLHLNLCICFLTFFQPSDYGSSGSDNSHRAFPFGRASPLKNVKGWPMRWHLHGRNISMKSIPRNYLMKWLIGTVKASAGRTRYTIFCLMCCCTPLIIADRLRRKCGHKASNRRIRTTFMPQGRVRSSKVLRINWLLANEPEGAS